MAEEIMLTEENFESEVIKSDKPVFVDFWAPWCGPCKMMGPIFKEAADENDGSCKFGKVNIDDYVSVAKKYGVRNIPTIMLFKNGEVYKKSVGVINKKELLDMMA